MIRLLHQRVLEWAGLPQIRFVDLRHTYVVQALRSGKELREISAELGHTRARETRKRYKDYLPKGEQNSHTTAPCAAAKQDQTKTADMLQRMLAF